MANVRICIKAIIEGSPENFYYHKAFDCKQRDVFPPNCKEEPSVKQQAADEPATNQSKPGKLDGEEEFKILDEIEGDGEESQDETMSSIKLDTSEEWDSETKLINGAKDSTVPVDEDDMWKQEFAVDANA